MTANNYLGLCLILKYYSNSESLTTNFYHSKITGIIMWLSVLLSLCVWYISTYFCLAPIYLLNTKPHITGFIGDTVTMQVSSLGLGQHTYQWTRMGRNIKSDATGMNSTRMILPDVSFDDGGSYLFTAKSQWSLNQTKVDLKVTCELWTNATVEDIVSVIKDHYDSCTYVYNY